MASKLRLISYQRENSSQILNIKPSPHSELAISFIVYSPNKKLSFIEDIIREKQKMRNDIGFSKSKDLPGLNYSIEIAPAGIPLFCISDDQLNEQIISTFMVNRQISEKQQIFNFALLLDDVSNIPKQYYTLYGINMITTQKQELIAHLQKAFEIRKGLTAQSSASSLNSEENKQLQQRFNDSKNKYFTSEMISGKQEREEKMFVQESPGFNYDGNYPQQKKVSACFTHTTRELKFFENGKGSGADQWYHIESRQPSRGFTMTTSRKFQSNHSNVPGPGQYDIK